MEARCKFKRGKFGAGVLHGVEQIGERLRGGSEFYGSKSESVAEPEIAQALLLGGVAIVLPGGGSSGSDGSDSDGGCSSGGGGGGASW